MKIHLKLHKQEKSIKKINPKKIVAKRKNEILCILEESNSKSQDAEWIDEEDVISNESLPSTDDVGSIPVIVSILYGLKKLI